MIWMYILIGLLAVALSIFTIVFVLFCASLFNRDAPFVPSRRASAPDIVKALELQSGSVFYELGCGDGRIIQAVLEAYPTVRAVGYDNSWIVSQIARLRLWQYNNACIQSRNIFNADLSPATHIYVYLLTDTLRRLEFKLDRELQQGTRVVSCDFQFARRKPVQCIPVQLRNKVIDTCKVLYVYEW